MGDRQDIDALLIGALYGELEGADKARLDAHLSSHPGDRAAMDALAETRTRVRDSLARMPEVDPAPAISTLLLQEAARRAPRKAAAGGGVLGWFAGLFQPIVRHPALAGAMALLLAGGAAGMLYKSGKVDSTEQAEATPAAPATGGAAPAGKPDVAENLDRTDGYQVRLADQDKEKEKAPPADDGVIALDGKLKGKDEGAATPAFHGGSGTAATKATSALAKNGEKAKGSGYMEVTTPDRQLKQLDDHEQVAQQNQAGTYRGASGGGGGASAGSGSGSAAPGGSVAGDATTITTADVPAQAPSPHAATAPAAYDKAKDAKLDEWAQVQHQHVVQLVKAGNCPDAGKLASEIAARAPEYYAAHVENDRAVRGCKQYIDQEKRKKANEEYKSRARNSFEPDLEAPAAN